MLNLKKHLKASFALAALIVSTSASLYSQCCGLEPVSEISLSGGWRRDNFKAEVENTQTATTVVGQSTTIIRSTYEQELKLKNVDIWQIGGRLQFGFPECFCDCDYSWLSQFYVKGYYYYGWISDGKYSDDTSDPYITDITGDFHLGAKTHKGRTVDGSIALGYLIPVCDNFGVAPIGGWSYHQLRADLKDTFYSEGSDLSESRSNIDKRFTTTWKGPWLGVEAVYYMDLCGSCLRFDLGYEYHWGKWTGERTINEEATDYSACLYFNDKRHSKKVQGQVGYLTAWWPVCDCWEIGLGVNYNYFKARKGGQDPRNTTFNDLCDPTQTTTPTTVYTYATKSKDVVWRSVGVTLDLGYRF